MISDPVFLRLASHYQTPTGAELAALTERQAALRAEGEQRTLLELALARGS